MKKKSVIGIIILIIILLWAFLLFFQETYKKEHLGLNNTIEYLEDCIEQSKLPLENRSIEFYACVREPDIPLEEDIEKLKLLENLEGIEICNLGMYEPFCNLSDYTSKDCEKIWNIDYKTMGVRPCPRSISIYECSDELYIYFSYTHIVYASTDTQIYKIKLDEEIIQALKHI